jgi:hypothetical protein
LGRLTYGSSDISVWMADRDLAHLQLVVGMKLGVKESFFVSWRNEPGTGIGRSSLWIAPSTVLRFDYERPNMPSIDRDVVMRMLDGSFAVAGLQLDDFASDPNSRPRASWV